MIEVSTMVGGDVWPAAMHDYWNGLDWFLCNWADMGLGDPNLRER